MEGQAGAKTQTGPKASPWAPWLRVAGAAALLLLLSVALWLWQTWPVRELLRPDAATQPVQR